MSKPEAVALVHSDDWMGVYLDGRLAFEDHLITDFALLTLVGVDYTLVTADPDWMEEEGHLPESIDDVVEES